MKLKRSSKYNLKAKEAPQDTNGSPDLSLSKKEHYITFHKKLHVEHRNREFKNIYLKLSSLSEPKDQYKMLYHIDTVHVINKLLKQYIFYQELVTFSIKSLTLKAQFSLNQANRLFLVDEATVNDKKKINLQYRAYVSQFFHVLITFYLNLSILSLMHNRPEEARTYYEATYKIVRSIINSSASKYKLLRKISEFYLSYTVFLINCQKQAEAVSLLLESLKNEANILVITLCRGKQIPKGQLRQRKIQIYNRLFAIFHNLSTCYQQQGKIYRGFLFLKQCKVVAELKYAENGNDFKISWTEILKKSKSVYDDYKQLRSIVQVYFEKAGLEKSLNEFKNYEVSSKSNYLNDINGNDSVINQIGYEFMDSIAKTKQKIKSTHKLVKNEEESDVMKKSHFDLINQIIQKQILNVSKPKKRVSIRRSLSLEDSLSIENNKRLLKDYGHQLLFFGVDIFNKLSTKKQPAVEKSKSQSVMSSYLSLKSSYNKLEQPCRQKIQNNSGEKVESRLMKKGKRIENRLFRRVQEPLEYQMVEERIERFWYQEKMQNNKTKQHRCLLEYKRHHLQNNKYMVRQELDVNEEIRIVDRREQDIFRQSKKSEPQEQQKQVGVHLFKKIIIKHMKGMDIKKNEALVTIIKRKRLHKAGYNACSYSEPQFSIDYLIQKIKKDKNREELVQKIKNEEKNELIQLKKHHGREQNNMLLSKNRQIPNLFLSYITSSGFSGEAKRIKVQKPNK